MPRGTGCVADHLILSVGRFSISTSCTNQPEMVLTFRELSDKSGPTGRSYATVGGLRDDPDDGFLWDSFGEIKEYTRLLAQDEALRARRFGRVAYVDGIRTLLGPLLA